jgi:hypothetical protein
MLATLALSLTAALLASAPAEASGLHPPPTYGQAAAGRLDGPREALTRGEEKYFEEIWAAEQKFLEAAGGAGAGEPWAALPGKADSSYTHVLEGKAVVDSCFCDYTHVYWEECSAAQSVAGCENRTSESYAWGMTRTADFVFWGTVANEQCLETAGNFETPSGIACTDSYDLNWKIPSVYMMDVLTSAYTSIAPADISGQDFERLNNTVGLRSAGQKNGVVILGGFARSLESVYVFSFHAATGAFLGSHEFENSNDLRKFTQDDAHGLYLGVSRVDGTGDIFRFTGDVNNPVSFGFIANIPGILCYAARLN